MVPRHNDVWNEAKNKNRREVNEWIRKDAGFDAVLTSTPSSAIRQNPT